jgi:nitrate/nitrite-specific signal transduction histidine kinase
MLGLWNQLRSAPLHFQLRRIRWLAPVIVLLLAALHQLLLQNLIEMVFPSWAEAARLLVYTFTGSIVAWIGISWLATAVTRRAEAEMELRVAYNELETNHQKLLALHDLGQSVAAANDKQAIFELTARAPLHLTEANSSTIVTFDGENGNSRLKLDMAWGLSENYLKALRVQIEKGVLADRCRTCTVLHAHADGDCPLFAGLQDHARQEGIRSLICLPIVQANERIAVLSAYFPSADGPPEDQIRLLNILGGVVAAALESLRNRQRQVKTLNALDRAAQTADALDDLAVQVLNIAISGWEAEAGGLFLYDEKSQTWSCSAQYNLGQKLADPRFDLGLDMARQTLNQNFPVIISDLEPDAGHGLRAAAAAPLMTEGQTLGALFLGAKRPLALNDSHQELLATMAYQIALAVRNAQLYTQLGQMAVLEERYRLSREFHDGLAQTLSYLGLQSERLESLLKTGQTDTAVSEFAELRRSIRAAYVDVREAIDGLRLGVEDVGQLAARLGEYTTEFTRQTGLPVHFTAVPDQINVSPATAVQLLRIAQEALTNVRKHAQAQEVDVRLRQIAGELELTITDDGHGFPNTLPVERQYRSHGLASMRERTESLGGMLTVATQPGQGTRITVVVPVELFVGSGA